VIDYEALDPDMQRIVDYCYRAGLFWTVNTDASRIEFMCPSNPRTVLAAFDREADPDDVLESLRLLTVFQ
jgi:hypothetical protein